MLAAGTAERGLAAAIVAVFGAVALGLARLFSHAFYGVSPADLTMFAGVALVEIAVVLLVSLGPVRRAARIDPVVALRAE